MAYLTSPTEVLLGPQGRLVIPAQLRRVLGFEPGDTLLARLENGRLILEKREAIRRRLKDRFARLPQGKTLASELLIANGKKAGEGGARRLGPARLFAR